VPSSFARSHCCRETLPQGGERWNAVNAPDILARSRFTGCLLGLAVGDAVGTTVEFKPRGSFPEVRDMVGGGPFGLKPGQWTDDTSMALCLATSLVERGGFDARDQMERYLRWRTEGYLSSTGTCFDIGTTVGAALDRFRQTGDPVAGSTHPQAAGNGSIMRLAPVVLRYFPDRGAVEHFAAESSRTTHGAAECIDACRLLARVLCRALEGQPKEEVLKADRGAFPASNAASSAASEAASGAIAALADGSYRGKPRQEIRGSGYVVESLEAALWCFDQAESFEEAILLAANLGDDADTTAAVTGQIAGAFHGEEGIPRHWLDRLFLRDEIAALADRLYRAGG